MDPSIVGAIGFVSIFVLISLGMPIGISFLTIGFVGTAYLAGVDSALSALARTPFTWITDYVFMTVPLFVLSGVLIAKSGVANELFAVAYKWLGRLPGGLAMATMGAIGLFGAISGSSTAGVATMSTVCYPEMKRYKYQDRLATGCIVAGGGIDLMIPPSLGFIIFGIMTEESIGKLFLAGVLPGILQISSFMLLIYVLVRLNPAIAPIEAGERFTWYEKFASLRHLWSVIVLFGVVLGGIYLGLFTPIEAGAVASAGAFVIVVITGRLSWRILLDSLLETTTVTVIILTLLLGAMVFNVFLTLSGLPQEIAGLLDNVGSPMIGLLLILAIYMPLGMVMDATAMIVLSLPLFLPFLINNDINLIWFGVLLMMMVQIGLITPPIGMNVFVVKTIIPQVAVKDVFWGSLPFVVVNFILLILLIMFPEISLYLPGVMR